MDATTARNAATVKRADAIKGVPKVNAQEGATFAQAFDGGYEIFRKQSSSPHRGLSAISRTPSQRSGKPPRWADNVRSLGKLYMLPKWGKLPAYRTVGNSRCALPSGAANNIDSAVSVQSRRADHARHGGASPDANSRLKLDNFCNAGLRGTQRGAATKGHGRKKASRLRLEAVKDFPVRASVLSPNEPPHGAGRNRASLPARLGRTTARPPTRSR